MTIHKRHIKKRTNLSPSEGVQSQNNPIDGLPLHPIKSVAASSQQVYLLLAQPEHLEQGREKFESAPETKIHQAIDGQY